MTETAKTVFEKYEVRKSCKQKKAFRKFVMSFCDKNGYKVSVEKGYFGANNIVVGDIDDAKVVYTAHYDTCPSLPFPNFITPKNFLIYLLYQIALTLVIVAVIFGTEALVLLGFGQLAEWTNSTFLKEFVLPWIPTVIALIFLLLITSGPANKHTANDNTSGVNTLLDIMSRMPEDKKSEVVFVFFDLEEMGMLGSSAFSSKHKKQMEQKPLINFDCVSDGEHILFVLRKSARHLKSVLVQAFASTDNVKCEVATNWIFYPSDQMNFKVGIGVASLKSTAGGLLYMDKIHTNRDTVYREENIEFLANGAIKLLDLI